MTFFRRSGSFRESFGEVEGNLPGYDLHLLQTPPDYAQSFAQKLYIDAIRTHDIVFSIGPAGTGKTYLAMAMGVASLTKKRSTASSSPGRP